MSNTRENSIDILRFVGLTMIFLAHAKVGDPFFQFRCFDVPMMLFISGLSYSGRSTGNYLQFVWKRATRLLIPLYTFLCCYFILKWGLSELGLCKMIPSNVVWGTLALFHKQSIGKVWIFRVFLIVMLLTPLLVAIEKKASRVWFWAILAAMFAAQFALVQWVHPLKAGRFVEDWCLYAVGYSIPFMLGCHMRYAGTGKNWIATAILATCFILAAVFFSEGKWLYFQNIKYPPHAYFLLWGCLISALLWTTRDYWVRFLDCRFTRWIGQNTIWIYIWHMPFVRDVTNKCMKTCHWSLKFTVLVLVGVGIYAIQYLTVRTLERKYPESRILKYFKG